MGDPGDGGELKRVESYQWPAAHIGHLSDGQAAALEKFKTLCEGKGYYKPADDKTPPTHDDETLLRYLRARKFIPQDAFVQFKDTEDWRKENALDKLYETIDIHEYDESRKLYPQWTGRRDKRGIPFYVYEIKSVDSKAVSAYTTSKDSRKQSTNTKVPWKMLKLFALYENLCRFVLPMCSAIPDRPNSETPISQSSNIVDLDGVGFTKLWNLRNHMSDASQLATAHYPETLDRIFVVGAPSFFPTIWGWAQRWFDPITVSKIFILTQKNMKQTLGKFLDMENVPTKYGGTLDWKFGDMPNLEPAIANSLRWREVIEQKGHKTLPIGPIKWEFDEDGDLVATAVGSQDGQPRQRVIAALHPESGVAQLALSPGRTDTLALYHSTPAHIPAPAPDSPASEGVKTNMNGDANLNVGKAPNASVPATSRAGTYTAPWSDEENEVASPPFEARQGTSSMKYQQQEGTHAEGQLAHGTPYVTDETIHGDQPAVTDPRTVGQAPKEHPDVDTEEPPSAIEKAKDYANQAYTQAMSAMGMGGKAEEKEVEQVAKKEDPEIDNMANKNVEEFLRSQMASSKPDSTPDAIPNP